MEDRIITLQKEIIEDLWVIRGILYQQLIKLSINQKTYKDINS